MAAEEARLPTEEARATAAAAALLCRVAAFADLPPSVLAPLALEMQPVSFAPGTTVVREGETGDCLFVIAAGRAEARIRAVGGDALVVGTLGPNETFGEIALVRQTPRTATVVAITPLACFRLDAAHFLALLQEQPPLAAWYAAFALRVEILNFLKRAMPFSSLSAEAAPAMGKRLTEQRVAPGECVVRQGTAGDAFYLVREGEVEVIDETAGLALATLGPGDCFGEMALLTEEPRSATVRARTACTLLVLSRQALRDVLEAHGELEAGLVALATARHRPRRVEHWSMQEQRRADGEIVYVLKDDVRARYFSLSERGRWVWTRLDGSTTIRDLLLDYRRQYGEAGAGMIYPLLARLQIHGFARATAERRGARRVAIRGVSATAHRILTAQVTLPNFDAFLTALYRRIGHYSYTRVTQALWLLLSVVGGAAFLYLWFGNHVDLAASGSLGWLVPVLVVLGWLIHVPIHELQHALTAKHYGREVRRAGFGWYWFAPMFWTDTSDIWLESRGRRMAVSFAGPYSNLIMGGAVSLLVLMLPDGVARSALFDITLVLYVGFLTAFNPLMEYDGYYLLEDFLDTSNLRAKAMSFLTLDFPARLRARSLTRAEQGYALYGLCAIAYVVFMCSQIVLIYRARVEHVVGMHVPHLLAALLGWGLAALFLVLVGLGTVHDVSLARAARRTGATKTLKAVAALAGETSSTRELALQQGAGGEALEERISK